MAERLKALDWKSSNIPKVFVGSNPTLSATTRLISSASQWQSVSVPSRRLTVNPVRPGREQRQRRCRVPKSKLVRAASNL
jgi:hypothetical protein